MKNELQPTRATLKKQKQCKTIPRWLGKFLHFSSEKGEEELKKLPVQCRTFCLALIHDFAKQFYYKLMTWQCSNIFTILPSLQ